MAPDTGAAAAGIDEAYEFSAPRFFDFITEETEEAIRAAESWFEDSCSHPPSPFAPRIKESRAEAKVAAVLCDFADAEGPAAPKEEAVEEGVAGGVANKEEDVDGNAQGKKDPSFGSALEARPAGPCADAGSQQEEESAACSEAMSESPPADEEKKESPHSFQFLPSKDAAAKLHGGSSTPKMQRPAPPKMQRPAPPIKIAPAVSACAKTQANLSKLGPMAGSTSVKMSVIKGCRDLGAGKTTTAATDIAQDYQAVKRQKLDDGRTREILDVKTRVLHHKGGLAGSTELTRSNVRRSHDDAHCVKEVTSYVSAAELVKKFESGTRGLDIPHNRSLSHEDAAASRPKLIITRPKEPEFQTANRVRAVRVKSSAELEEEMLAKIPKFRARPFNKKIAEAPAFPPLPRKTVQVPKFNEFHLKTMERATRNADSCSEASCAATVRNQSKSLRLTPKPPQLHTAMRARPPSVKSSQELELEELEKAPKFKAKPLNKKILESKGDIGVFAQPKPQTTAPKEFHFSTDDRLGPPAVTDLFDKLSLYSESSSQHDRNVPRVTLPNPFNLHTEERGHLKERQLAAQLLQKQMEEEKARVPKANPYPYTTDYPVVPPKPEPKPCTRPEGFQLESLARHQLEQRRLMEEKERMEREEAQRRIVKAQPILKEDPIPLPEKERKPLTEVQQFALHVDERAVQRSEFDNMIKEKERTYKRLREESEFAQKMEEEKALKQLRRTMVPHARPLPKFDRPFRPQRSTKEVTRPKSPHLLVDERGARRFIR
ncbi:hypothetical protein ACP4OV_029519 [Aristida adscensionis]